MQSSNNRFAIFSQSSQQQPKVPISFMASAPSVTSGPFGGQSHQHLAFVSNNRKNKDGKQLLAQTSGPAQPPAQIPQYKKVIGGIFESLNQF